jgi:hypothetical protein
MSIIITDDKVCVVQSAKSKNERRYGGGIVLMRVVRSYRFDERKIYTEEENDDAADNDPYTTVGAIHSVNMATNVVTKFNRSHYVHTNI